MLKAMFLNTWGGKLWDAGLADFYKSRRDEIDILGLQEVHREPYENSVPEYLEDPLGGNRIRGRQHNDLQRLFYDTHIGMHHMHSSHCLYDRFKSHLPVEFGNSMFIKRRLETIKHHTGMIFRKQGELRDEAAGLPAARSIHCVAIKRLRQTYLIINLHGIWTGNGKGDSSHRYEQSDQIIKFVNHMTWCYSNNTDPAPKVVVGGDFNLTSDTQAMTYIPNATKLINLNKIVGIRDTRTSFYGKEEREADFVLVSKNVNVHEYKVITGPEVSDHRPLVIHFD